MKKYFLLGLIVFGCLAFLFLIWKKEDLVPLVIEGKQTRSTYLVEIADTPLKAGKGLMYRKSMPKNQGMLFIFPYPSTVKMWMKNTYIPLDMLFFNAQNQVICIHENAHPLDESIISCPYPAQKVLELNAGEIQAKKIQLGDIFSLEKR